MTVPVHREPYRKPRRPANRGDYIEAFVQVVSREDRKPLGWNWERELWTRRSSCALTIPIMSNEGFWIRVQGHPRLGAGSPRETTMCSCVDASSRYAAIAFYGAHQGGHQDTNEQPEGRCHRRATAERGCRDVS